MILDLAILIVTIGINVFLGFLILIKNGKPIINKVFVCFILAISFWVLANYFADHAQSNQQAWFWSQMSWASAGLLLLAGSIFVHFFPFKDARSIKIKFFILSLITAGFCFFVLTNFFRLFIKETILGSQGIENIVYGPLFICGMLYFSAFVVFILIKFCRKYRKVSGFEKLQGKYFLLGWLGFLSIGIIFSLILPFFTNNALWSKFSPMASIILIGATTYAIVRHRLMDIRLFIQKTILYTMTFGFFLAIYFSLIYFLNKFLIIIASAPTVSSIISAALMLIFFPKFKLYFQKKTDGFFYRFPYDANRVLKEINEKCGRQSDFDNFFSCFITIIESNLKINKILLVVLQNDKNLYLIKNHNFSHKIIELLKSTACPDKIYEYFNCHKRAILTEEHNTKLEFIMNKLGWNQQAELIIKCGIKFILPIYRKGQLSAFFFFGPKLSQENYYPQDLQLFENLVDTLSLLFENIFLYNDLKKALIGMEDKVNQRTKELQELNANQSRFMADISHELQTPLAILKGNLSLLNQQKMSPAETRKYYLQMERSIDRLSHLIKDLIFLSKADAGKINIQKEYFNLSDLVQKAFDDSLILSEDKGIILNAEIEKNLWLLGDQSLIQSLLFNLISNALKFTEQNKEVKIKLLKNTDSANLIIEDQGIGIASENLPHIFSRFYRIEPQDKRKGTGLGLSICKWIVLAHNGKIDINSQLGKGTTINVNLPCEFEFKNEH